MNGFLQKHLKASVFEERMEEIPVVFPSLGISGENPISEGLKNLAEHGSLDVVGEALAHDMVHVDGVTSDQAVHFSKPRSSELSGAPTLFQHLS